MSVFRCECGRHVDTDFEDSDVNPHTEEMVCMHCYETNACCACEEWKKEMVVIDYKYIDQNYCESCFKEGEVA